MNCVKRKKQRKCLMNVCKFYCSIKNSAGCKTGWDVWVFLIPWIHFNRDLIDSIFSNNRFIEEEERTMWWVKECWISVLESRGTKRTSVLLVLLCTSWYFLVLLGTSSYFLYFFVLLGTSLYFLVLPYTSWYFPILLGTSLYFLVLPYTSWYFCSQNRTKVFCYCEMSKTLFLKIEHLCSVITNKVFDIAQ
jgi:hypothetical protein